jgi:hypothetical protein
MSEPDGGWNNFEEMLRSVVEELSESVQRTMDQVDLDGIAGTFGVDPDRAREWVDGAAGWMRIQFESMGEDVASRAAEHSSPQRADDLAKRPAEPSREPRFDDPLSSAGPHPLDLPTDEQGTALAALDSGRWTVEPGSNALASNGEGPGPSDALGLVRELRARDWIAADGEITLVGHHALSRWLDAKTPR